MKNILCFGDSNVFGFNPENGTRFDKNIRWTGVLSKLLEDKYNITEGGCNNRTCFMENPSGELFTGYRILPKLLDKKEYDIVILSVGTNDVQKSYRPSMDEIRLGIENLIKITRTKLPQSRIIIILPSVIKSCILDSYFSTLFDEESVEMSKCLPKIYRDVAERFCCEYVDLDGVADASDIDGLHFEIDGHRKIAERLHALIEKINF